MNISLQMNDQVRAIIFKNIYFVFKIIAAILLIIFLFLFYTRFYKSIDEQTEVAENIQRVEKEYQQIAIYQEVLNFHQDKTANATAVGTANISNPFY